MKTTKLSVAKLLQLEAELKDILGRKLSLNVKYNLLNLFKKVVEINKTFNTLREDLIKELGSLNSRGEYTVKYFDENKKITEAGMKMEENLTPVLKEELELTFKPISFTQIESVESEMVYEVLFSIIDFPEEV